MNWLHRLFNPHCLHCKEDDEDNKICNNCEYLKLLVEQLRKENRELLDRLLVPSIQPTNIESNEIPQPINTGRHVPFSVKRQELEARDRAEAERIKNNINDDLKRNIESLEDEILSATVDSLDLSEVKEDANS